MATGDKAMFHTSSDKSPLLLYLFRYYGDVWKHWINRQSNVAAVALTDKTARIAWEEGPYTDIDAKQIGPQCAGRVGSEIIDSPSITGQR